MLKVDRRCPHCNVQLVALIGTYADCVKYCERRKMPVPPEDSFGSQSGSYITIHLDKHEGKDADAEIANTIIHEAVHWAVNMPAYVYGETNLYDRAPQEQLCQIVEWVTATIFDALEKAAMKAEKAQEKEAEKK
jgi:hypothetical protein